MNKTLVWFNCKDACGGLVITDGVISETCPHFRWSIGHRLSYAIKVMKGYKKYINHKIIGFGASR
ncbi:hypothetical protein KAR91_38010 [Candidatus Pacearchaeota archaeon]|nr:hypothetical protein [Candidatus Pacearchaeota archaeon]